MKAFFFTGAGAGAGEKITWSRSRSKMDRFRNTAPQSQLKQNSRDTVSLIKKEIFLLLATETFHTDLFLLRTLAKKFQKQLPQCPDFVFVKINCVEFDYRIQGFVDRFKKFNIKYNKRNQLFWQV